MQRKERGRGECVALESKEFKRSKGDSMLVEEVLENILRNTKNNNNTIMKKVTKEYTTRKLDSPLTDNELNQWSKDGWELVGFSATPDTGLITANPTWFYYIFAREVEVDKKEKEVKVENTDQEFIDMIYGLYPSKCPKRGSSLGKCSKDKDRIKKLLKTYTKEQIEEVVRREVENKYGISYMQNFSTFLNNFPDPIATEYHSKVYSKKEEQNLVINGVRYK